MKGRHEHITLLHTHSRLELASHALMCRQEDDPTLQLVFFDYNVHQATARALHAKVLSKYVKPDILEVKLPILRTRLCHVLLKNGALIGYIYHKQDKTIKWIKELVIDPAHQKKGYGALLLQIAERHALERHCTHIVLSAVSDAVPFYEKYGFSNFYEKYGFSKGEDDLSKSGLYAMIKDLTQ